MDSLLDAAATRDATNTVPFLLELSKLSSEHLARIRAIAKHELKERFPRYLDLKLQNNVVDSFSIGLNDFRFYYHGSNHF